MKTSGPFAMSLERWHEVTEKQKVFADEYLIDLNATRAYKVAYPTVKNDDTAAQAGSRLLRNVKVAEYIQERMQERQKRTEITQDRVLNELAAMAFADVAEAVEIRLKPSDKLKALELLGRHLGMFRDRVEVSGIDEEKKKLDDILRQMRGDG